jgi:hypothetical protein
MTEVNSNVTPRSHSQSYHVYHIQMIKTTSYLALTPYDCSFYHLSQLFILPLVTCHFSSTTCYLSLITCHLLLELHIPNPRPDDKFNLIKTYIMLLSGLLSFLVFLLTFCLLSNGHETLGATAMDTEIFG